MGGEGLLHPAGQMPRDPHESTDQPLTFTAWQLTAGGLLLLPAAFWLEPAPPAPTGTHVLGFVCLGPIGAAVTYILRFRGLARIEPAVAATLGFLSPVTAVILGWWVLDQSLGPWQVLGVLVVLGCVWLGQHAAMPRPGTR